MNMTLRRIAAFAIISACTLSAGAQPFTFTRIIDSNTEIPDSGGKQFHGDAFSNLSISQQRVVFQGMGPGTSGIYEWVNGSLNRIADTTTVTPGAGGLFTMFGPGIDNSGEHASFVGRSGSTGGLYRRSGDVLQRVVDTTLTAPNGGVYGAIGIPSVEGTSIAFFAGHVVGPSAVPSVYRWDSGIITTVADTSTPVPGGQGNFTFFDSSNVRLDSGAVWFRGRDANNRSGFYRRDGNGLQAVVDTNTNGPAGMGKFTALVGFDVDGSDIILRGATETGDTSPGGVFVRVGGVFTKVAADNAPAPGGGTFSFFETLTLDDGISVFSAQRIDGYVSIYTNLGGTLQRIIGPGQILDGKTVRTTEFARDGNQLAIHVTFTDHIPSSGQYSEAIYLTTLPGPGALLPFAGAALWAARRSR